MRETSKSWLNHYRSMFLSGTNKWGNKEWALRMSNGSLSDLGDREGFPNKATPEVILRVRKC